MQIFWDGATNPTSVLRRLLAVAALLSGSALAPHAMPPQAVDVDLVGSSDGTVFLELSSVGRPFTFDAEELRFTWQAYNRIGELTTAAYALIP
ncbi:MAG TPA: hypothetical protein VGF86_13810 [Candidatus Tumulicola sp.]|jgi:hypothetical protein